MRLGKNNLILDKAHWAFRQSAVDMGEEELGRETFKSPYQSSHDLMLFSSNQQVYKNYMGSLGGDIINSMYSLGSNFFNQICTVLHEKIESKHEFLNLSLFKVTWIILVTNRREWE